FSPDGRLLALGTKNGEVRILDLASGEMTTVVGVPEGVSSIKFDTQGRWLVIGANVIARPPTFQQTVVVLDARSHQEITRLKASTCLALSKDGKQLATTTDDFKNLQVWDIATRKQMITYGLRGGTAALALTFTAHGKLRALVKEHSKLTVLTMR